MFSTNDLLFPVPEPGAQPAGAGGFARRVLVVRSSDAGSVAAEPFLSKILAAANLNLAQDTLLIDCPEPGGLRLLPVLKSRQPTHVLVFGATPELLGLRLQAPLYQAFYFYNTTFLFADKLSLLEPDKNRKGQLWRALQGIFL